MEAKLAEYRLNKKSHSQISSVKESSLLSRLRWPSRHEDNTNGQQPTEATHETQNVPEPTDFTKLKTKEVRDANSIVQQTLDSGSHEHADDQSGSSSNMSRLQLCLKILLWVILWAFFIEIGFGAVYFIVSSLCIIYRNTGTRKKDKELSAYSVFNPNFEQLEGTFTAEQFERELRYGPSAVRSEER